MSIPPTVKAQAQAIAGPKIAAFFTSDLCHDGQIVRPVGSDAYGNPLPPAAPVGVRAWRAALSPGAQARLAGTTATAPTWELLLPLSAPVQAQGWRYQDGEVTLEPTGDASDAGDFGLVYHIYCRAVSEAGER